MEAAIGVIGGSGLYAMPGLTELEQIRITTPFGEPSDAFLTGRLDGKRMVFLPRHGVGHRILPHEINFRANLWGMKHLGVDRLLSVSAVGSMKEAIAPGHLVLVDQFIDLTKRRVSSFYGDGLVVHVPFSEPICPVLRGQLGELGAATQTTVHKKGTYVCIEGPQFSTKAESLVYRGWGVDVVGMTNMPEAKLAREAEICYATIALATDYDCWHESEAPVTVEAVLATLKANVERAQRLIAAFVKSAPTDRGCALCSTAARTSSMTDPARVPEATKQRLSPILRHFMSV
jgi:5'-methylthioadenosine phosphorylase